MTMQASEPVGSMRASEALPPQSISQEVLRERYAAAGEGSISDVRDRVARALAQAERPAARANWQRAFRLALDNGFIPAGRIHAGAGIPSPGTLINCFVQPIGDTSIAGEDGLPDLPTALSEATATLGNGGGVGYDFSDIRPAGAIDVDGSSIGLIPCLHLFDQACANLMRAGPRRGAQMAVLRCDHPDVESFIRAKESGGLSTFNLSVAITDAFMLAVEGDWDVDLVHRAKPSFSHHPDGVAQRRKDGSWLYRKQSARTLWDLIMRSAYARGEPGVLFIDRINRDNNLSYCESISATNPCGEQPLPAYGACCLGSMDLTRFVRDPFTKTARFDDTAFSEIVRVAVRMLDNALDVSRWPLIQQYNEAMSKRRIGLGLTGLGDALVMLNLRYDSEQARGCASRMAQALRNAAYRASCDLAAERGAFPLFDADRYLGSPCFASRLPDSLKSCIQKQGLRNSHLLSVAPAGTISVAFADNVSNGIEPPFAWRYIRHKRMPDGTFQERVVEDHAWRLYRATSGPEAPLSDAFTTAYDISASAHLAMVCAVAPFIDAAVSKTVNVPADLPFESFRNLYMQAWHGGLKGLTSYRPNAVLPPVLRPCAPQASLLEANC